MQVCCTDACADRDKVRPCPLLWFALLCFGRSSCLHPLVGPISEEQLQQLRSRKRETPDFTLSRIVRRADSYLSLRERWRWPDKLFPLEAPPARFHRAASSSRERGRVSPRCDCRQRCVPVQAVISPPVPRSAETFSLKKIQTPTRGIESQNSKTTVRRGDYAASPPFCTLHCALCAVQFPLLPARAGCYAGCYAGYYGSLQQPPPAPLCGESPFN